MNFFQKNEIKYNLYSFFFVAFLFFNTIFNSSTRTNNLLHLSIITFLISLFYCKPLRDRIKKDKILIKGLLITACFVLYFAFTNLWSSVSEGFFSTLTHGVYLIFYLTLISVILNSQKRNMVLSIIVSGFAILFIYLLITNFNVILHRGPVIKWNPTAQNVIDLSGLAAIALITACHQYFQSRNKLYLLAMILFAFVMLLSQSRGPVLSLLVAFAVCSKRPAISKKNILITLLFLAILFFFIKDTELGVLITTRISETYSQSFLRFSIWLHTLDLVRQQPFFGYGVNYSLNFINYSGEHIQTTHSLYMGALLKGGILGLITLLAMIIYCLKLAITQMKLGENYASMLLIFSLCFFLTEGMFVIGNPQPFWYLFWFPIGCILSSPSNIQQTSKN